MLPIDHWHDAKGPETPVPPCGEPGCSGWIHTAIEIAIAALLAACLVLAAIHSSYAAERDEVYGEDIDQVPWSPAACAAIASYVNVASVVKASGGVKARFFAIVRARVTGQALREISDAWDRDTQATTWYAACTQRLEGLVNPGGTRRGSPI